MSPTESKEFITQVITCPLNASFTYTYEWWLKSVFKALMSWIWHTRLFRHRVQTAVVLCNWETKLSLQWFLQCSSPYIAYFNFNLYLYDSEFYIILFHSFSLTVYLLVFVNIYLPSTHPPSCAPTPNSTIFIQIQPQWKLQFSLPYIKTYSSRLSLLFCPKNGGTKFLHSVGTAKSTRWHQTLKAVSTSQCHKISQQSSC